jgi:radical SAM protein with 4Fe4S-binding SPASM domain
LGVGWYGVEDTPSGTAVWSTDNAEIRIAPDVTRVVLGFATHYYQWTGNPQVVKFAKDGREVFALHVTAERTKITINCEGNSLISIQATTAKPAEFEQSSDNRALGICLDELIIERPWRPLVCEQSVELPSVGELNPTGIPGTLQIEITSACNLKCKMCTNHASKNPRFGPLKAHMDVSVWEKLRPALKHAEVLVFLGGGEVFTHPQFLTYLEEADGLGLRTVFSTNGQLLGGEAIDRLAGLRNLHRVTVSLDSPDPEIYERIRGRPLSPVLQGLRDLGRRSALVDRVSVCAVVMKSTLKSLAGFPQQLAELGIRHFVLRGVFDYDFSLGDEIPDYDRDDVAVLSSIKDECGARGIRISLLPTIPAGLVDVSHDDLQTEKPQDWGDVSGPETKQCFDPWEKAVITRDGAVYPCDVYGQSSGALGNLGEQPFEDVWRGELFTQFRSDLLNGRRIYCASCPRRQTGPHPMLHYAARIVNEECWSSAEEIIVRVQNIGSLTWTRGVRLWIGTSVKRDRTDSAFYHSSWLTQNRVCTFSEEVVAPGEKATFRFRVSPVKPAILEHFQLVFEGRLWLPNTVFQIPLRSAGK